VTLCDILGYAHRLIGGHESFPVSSRARFSLQIKTEGAELRALGRAIGPLPTGSVPPHSRGKSLSALVQIGLAILSFQAKFQAHAARQRQEFCPLDMAARRSSSSRILQHIHRRIFIARRRDCANPRHAGHVDDGPRQSPLGQRRFWLKMQLKRMPSGESLTRAPHPLALLRWWRR